MQSATLRYSKRIRGVRTVGAVMLAMLVLSLVVSGLERDLAYVVMREDGWVESATLVFYAMALIGCLYMMWSRHWPAAWSGALLIVATMLRELDAHKTFTLYSLSSIRYWRSDFVSGLEKGGIVAIMLVLTILVVRAAWPPFWRRLRAAEPHAVTLAGISALIATSLILDAIHFDYSPGKVSLFLWAVEETFEMGIPICILVALIQWELHVRRARGAGMLENDR